MFVAALVFLAGCGAPEAASPAPAAKPGSWLGVHLFVQSDDAADALAKNLPRYAALGVNTIVVEVNYSLDFQSHPELRNRHFISRAAARRLADAAKRNGIALIPELDCLGHQSGGQSPLPLLSRRPEFAEPVGSNTDPDGAHLLSWCPLHPDVNPVVFALIDELVGAFDAKAFHAGMDEVFCIASDACPRCRGRDPAELFAKAVNDLHGHIVGKRHWEMLIWGDRLLDSRAVGGGKWEAARNGTHGAADLIPKDIIVCDWHYEKQADYPSVPLLLQKGFRVWPAGWKPAEATVAYSRFAHALEHARLIGYLATAWGSANPRTMAGWPPTVEALQVWTER